MVKVTLCSCPVEPARACGLCPGKHIRQLLPLVDTETLLQGTARRVAAPTFLRISS